MEKTLILKLVTELLGEMNEKISSFGVKFGIREEYAIEYLEQIQQQYVKLCGFDPETAVRGRGHHKTIEQRHYDKLSEYIARLKKYAEHIKICGDERNSYSKTAVLCNIFAFVTKIHQC